jgi:putative ABC transport system substrate-binding protein
MKIKKRSICSLLILAVLFQGALLISCKKKKIKTYSVGMINIVPDLDQTLAGFKEGMSELGYIEGKNINYIYSGPTTDMSKLPETARTLLAAGTDLIFSLTTPATLAAKKAAAGIGVPVLFAVVTDPLGAGIVKSIQRPEGNITGVMFGIQEARRLEWLLKIAPGTRKIYVPYNSKDKSPVLALKTIEKAAVTLDVTIIARKFHNPETLNNAILHIPPDADAVFLMPDSLLSTRLPDIVAAANRRKLPTSGSNISAIKSHEILTSYGFDQHRCGKQAARLAHQIFIGTAPSQLPVEMAEFFLGINLKVAKEIGLSIPEEILSQAAIIVR